MFSDWLIEKSRILDSLIWELNALNPANKRGGRAPEKLFASSMRDHQVRCLVTLKLSI